MIVKEAGIRIAAGLTDSTKHAFAVAFGRQGDVGVLCTFEVSSVNDVLVNVAVFRDELQSATPQMADIRSKYRSLA